MDDLVVVDPVAIPGEDPGDERGSRIWARVPQTERAMASQPDGVFFEELPGSSPEGLEAEERLEAGVQAAGGDDWFGAEVGEAGRDVFRGGASSSSVGELSVFRMIEAALNERIRRAGVEDRRVRLLPPTPCTEKSITVLAKKSRKN